MTIFEHILHREVTVPLFSVLQFHWNYNFTKSRCHLNYSFTMLKFHLNYRFTILHFHWHYNFIILQFHWNNNFTAGKKFTSIKFYTLWWTAISNVHLYFDLQGWCPYSYHNFFKRLPFPVMDIESYQRKRKLG